MFARAIPSLARWACSEEATLIYSRVLFIAGSFGVVVYLARRFENGGFAAFVLAISILAWVERALANGFYHAMANLPSEQLQTRFRAMLKLQLFWALAAMFSFFLLAKPIAAAAHQPLLAPCLFWAGVDLVPYALYTSSMAFLNRRNQLRAQATVAMVYACTKFALMVGLVAWFDQVEFAFIGMACASLCAWLIGLLLHRNPASAGVASKPANTRSSSLLLSVILSLLVGAFLHVDIWLIQLVIKSDTIMEDYAVAQSFHKAFVALLGALFLKLYAQARGKREISELLLDISIRRTCILIITLCIGWAISVPFVLPMVVPILFGPDFMGAIWWCRTALPLLSFLALLLATAQVLWYLDKSMLQLRILLLGLITFTLTGMWFLGQLGPAGLLLAIASTALVLLAALCFRGSTPTATSAS